MDVVLEGEGEAVHEWRAGRDDVAVKHVGALLARDLDALARKLLAQLLLLGLLLLSFLVGESAIGASGGATRGWG